MVKEVEGTFEAGDISLYTKSWLVRLLANTLIVKQSGY